MITLFKHTWEKIIPFKNHLIIIDNKDEIMVVLNFEKELYEKKYEKYFNLSNLKFKNKSKKLEISDDFQKIKVGNDELLLNDKNKMEQIYRPDEKTLLGFLKIIDEEKDFNEIDHFLFNLPFIKFFKNAIINEYKISFKPDKFEISELFGESKYKLSCKSKKNQLLEYLNGINLDLHKTTILFSYLGNALSNNILNIKIKCSDHFSLFKCKLMNGIDMCIFLANCAESKAIYFNKENQKDKNEEAEIDENAIETEKELKDIKSNDGINIEKPKRKRGRPPKNKENNIQIKEEINNNTKNEIIEPPKKKRGRKPKNKEIYKEEINSNNDDEKIISKDFEITLDDILL